MIYPSRAIFYDQDVESIRRPLDQATVPPSYYYTSKELFELEVARIFLKEWLWVGHVDEVTQPGDFFTYVLVGEPIVVVRDLAGTLRAFSNVCRHRGAVVQRQEKGNCKAFVCPYHAWTYTLTGDLRRAPGMEGVKGFDTAQQGLIPLRVETWEGIIFVNFDSQARPLAPLLGDLSERFKRYKIKELICLERQIWDFPANWKMTVENAMEAYHAPAVHKTLLEGNSALGSVRNWEFENNSRASYEAKNPLGSYEVLVNRSLEPVTLNKHGSAGAWVIDGLTDEEQRQVLMLLLYPNCVLVFLPDHMLCFVMQPDGPDNTKVTCDWHFPKHATERPDFKKVAKDIVGSLEAFNVQDSAMMGLQYRGYRSRLYRPGRYSLHEPFPHLFARYVLDRVFESESPKEL